MKKLFAVLPLAIAAATCAPAQSTAPSVVLNGLGSSALFLEAGLGTTLTPVGATCWWTGNNSSTAGNVVTAKDTKNSTAGVTDTGNAWVAWTTGTGTGASCATPVGPGVQVWSYLQTDSVVGNRCLFNAQGTTPTCSISYPTTAPASAGLLFPLNDSTKVETALPNSIATALNSAKVNYAGTDIRPEDAEFAVTRATTGCAVAVASGSQYLGMGYNPANTDTNINSVKSFFSGSIFNTTLFTLPSTFFVTPVGATPILVAVNGFSSINNISSASLAQFLDGTFSFTGQASGSGASGNPVTVLVREPLSGTYNTMEYNVPNRTMSDGTYNFKTSQDVGQNQPTTQQVCAGDAAGMNPMNIATASGGHRRRAIGTGQELSEVLDTTNNGSDILGYGFWSVANYKGFNGSTTTHYLTVDSVDPLRTTSVSGNPIPTTDQSSVTLNNVKNGNYPIWSLIRFVTADTTSQTAAATLATATDNFVSFGSATSRPDFIIPSQLTVVRSHFIPPAGSVQPTTASDGHVGNISSSVCSATEAGGDVGGVVMTLAVDSAFCDNNGVTTGHTGQRR